MDMIERQLDFSNESIGETAQNAPKILVIDDEASVRRTVCRELRNQGCDYAQAANADEAKTMIKDRDFDLVLCDVKMPGESGMDLIKHIYEECPDTAVIMITGVGDMEIAKNVLESGAYGYVTKPFRPDELMFNVSGALRRRALELENRTYHQNLEKEISERTDSLRVANERLGMAMNGFVEALAMTVEMRDPYTAGHQNRVSSLACAITEELGYDGTNVEGIRMAAKIHDLGKITVPAEILNKPGRLTEIEFTLIKTHSRLGYEILKDIAFPWPIAQIVLQHHERLDGSGYPQGLTEKEILLEAKILAVADVIEAMASHRPYRPALSLDEALEEIVRHKGRLYDSEVTDACLRLFREKNFKLPS
ncbi:MAG: response regulator [Deltaproteobacteria bacterium]|nr:response regulator [Deltaproteobacteria bacterium]